MAVPVWECQLEDSLPTYQYACTACDHRFEAVQSFSDDSLTECHVCGGALRKVFSSVGIVFKGSGFYRTDSRSGSGAAASVDAKVDAKTDAKVDASAGSSESKSGPKHGELVKVSGSSSSAKSSSGSAGSATPAA